MKANLDENTSGTDRLFVLSGVVTGVLALVAFYAEGAEPNPPSPTVLNYALSQSEVALYSFRSFAWGLFAVSAIAFFAMAARSLRIRSESASVATLMSVIGVTLYASRGILQDAAWTTAGTTAASGTTAAYLANLLGWTVNPLLPLGGAIWGVGFLLFGILARRSGSIPKWLTIVAVVGGIGGWAIFPALNLNGEFIGYLFTEILLPFTTAVWCFACAATVLRWGRGKHAAA